MPAAALLSFVCQAYAAVRNPLLDARSIRPPRPPSASRPIPATSPSTTPALVGNRSGGALGGSGGNVLRAATGLSGSAIAGIVLGVLAGLLMAGLVLRAARVEASRRRDDDKRKGCNATCADGGSAHHGSGRGKGDAVADLLSKAWALARSIGSEAPEPRNQTREGCGAQQGKMVRSLTTPTARAAPKSVERESVSRNGPAG